MKLGPARPKLSFRINGTRTCDVTRPEVPAEGAVAAPARTLPAVRRPMPALVIRDYRDDDGEAVS